MIHDHHVALLDDAVLLGQLGLRKGLLAVSVTAVMEGINGNERTVSLELSPSFLPVSLFIHSFVLSLAPLFDVRPGTTRGMVAICRLKVVAGCVR